MHVNTYILGMSLEHTTWDTLPPITTFSHLRVFCVVRLFKSGVAGILKRRLTPVSENIYEADERMRRGSVLLLATCCPVSSLVFIRIKEENGTPSAPTRANSCTNEPFSDRCG